MIAYKINDTLSVLSEFVVSIPKIFKNSGLVLQDNRNIVKKIATPEGTFVIKYFKGMYFLNRIAYSLFRKSKAERSYLYSLLLRQKGITTPMPVGWVDCYNWGFLTHSYFVSIYSPYKTLRETLDEYTAHDPSDKITLLQDLTTFTINLHRLGIYHEDFSTGNILVIKTGHGHEFSLVDLNRVRFRKVSYRKGLRNFATLGISPEEMEIMLREYAKQYWPEKSIDLFWKDKKRLAFLVTVRKRIRHYTLTPLEKMFSKC